MLTGGLDAERRRGGMAVGIAKGAGHRHTIRRVEDYKKGTLLEIKMAAVVFAECHSVAGSYWIMLADVLSSADYLAVRGLADMAELPNVQNNWFGHHHI